MRGLFCIICFLCILVAQADDAKQGKLSKPEIIENKTEITSTDSEPEFLVTNLTVSGHSLTQDFFAIQSNNKIFLSLNDFNNAVMFAITEDGNGNYSGSFINEANVFQYNASTRIAKIKDYDFEVSKEDILMQDGTLYFAMAVFEKFFPIRITFDTRSQVIMVESMEVLPVVKDILRKKKYNKFKKQDNTTDIAKPDIVPYDVFSMPFIDIINNTSIQNNRVANNTSILANMHFLKTLTTVTGNFDTTNAQTLPNLRVKQTYQDLSNPYQKSIFKPRKMEVGDINSNNINGVVNSMNGRGFAVSNIIPTWRIDMNQLNINGYSNPNWDVELYLNDTLYDIGKVDSSGLYNFVNVPLNIGQNTVKLVFYGPNGQRKENSKYINLDSSLVKKGAMYYDISSVESNKFLLGETKNPSQTDKVSMAQLQYGLSDLQTLQVSMISNSKSLTQKASDQYLSVGLNSFAFGVPINVSYIDYNNNEGYAISSKSTFDVKSLHFNVKHLFVNDGYRSRAVSAMLKQSYNVNVSHTARLFSLYVRNAIIIDEAINTNNTVRNITHTIGTKIFGVNINNNLIIRNTQQSIDGTFVSSYRLASSMLFRTNTMYTLNSQHLFRSLVGTINYNFSKIGLNGTLSGSRDTNSIGAGVSYKSNVVLLSINGTYDTQNVFNIRLTISSSIIPYNDGMHISNKTVANTSAIKGNVFIDNNNNDVYDDGDEPMKDVQLKVNNTPIQNKTDAQGRIFITPITSNTNTKITIDQSSINDIYTVPKKNRYDFIIPEAKIYSLNIPLTKTGIVEGYVTLQTKDGKKNISGVQVYLVNNNGEIVSKTKTANDGYYFFDIVKYGKYKVVVDNKYIEKYQKSL